MPVIAGLKVLQAVTGVIVVPMITVDGLTIIREGYILLIEHE
jgi:hypothetical protein